MVDHLGGGHSPFALAVTAKRMRSKEAQAGLLPFVAVAALRGGAFRTAPRTRLHHLQCAAGRGNARLQSLKLGGQVESP